MGFLRWLIGFIITLCIAAIAVLNVEASAPFFWSPIHEAVTLPVYIIALGAMAFGFVFGGVVVWFNGAGVRKTKRKQSKEIKLLEKEVTRLKEDKFVPSSAPASEMFPAIAAK